MNKMQIFRYLVFSMLVLATSARADYVAYAVGEKGSKPLPESIDAIEAKHLVNVKWGKYGGKKARVGVLGVQNKSTAGSVHIVSGYGTTTYSSNSNGVPVDGIDAILTDVLHRSGRFRMVERKELDATLREQDLGAGGRISKPSAARVGKVLGAQYLIKAVVTNYEPNFEGNDIGIGGLLGGSAGVLLGGLKVGSKKSMVGMNFRLINSETSEIVYTKQVQSIMSESSLGFGGLGFTGGGALGGFMSSYSKTPVGQAVIASVNKGVYELIKQVGAEAVSGSVIKAKGNKIYINLGKGQVKVGDRLSLFSKGESLIDPETGLNLGSEDEQIGSVQIVTAKKKYSIAKPIGIAGSKVKKGAKVVSNRSPESLQFASAWEEPKGGFFSGSSSSDNTESSDESEDDL